MESIVELCKSKRSRNLMLREREENGVAGSGKPVTLIDKFFV